MIDVRVTLMLTRGKDVLLSEIAGETAPAVVLALPSAGLDTGESFAEAATRLAGSIGFPAIEGLVVQHMAQESLADGGTALRVALAARVADDATAASGFVFLPAATLPENLDPVARAVFDTCRSGAHVVDLDGAVLPVSLFSRRPPPGEGTSAEGAELAAAPFEAKEGEGPTVAAAGAWFAGVLLWASSVLLMFDYHRVFRGGSGIILWAHVFAFAWYGCTRAGASLRGEADRTVRRATLVLVVGLSAVLFVAVVIGALDPNARGAYTMLGIAGIPTFFLAQWRSRRRMPALPPRAGPLLLLLEGVAVLVTLAIYAAR